MFITSRWPHKSVVDKTYFRAASLGLQTSQRDGDHGVGSHQTWEVWPLPWLCPFQTGARMDSLWECMLAINTLHFNPTPSNVGLFVSQSQTSGKATSLSKEYSRAGPQAAVWCLCFPKAVSSHLSRSLFISTIVLTTSLNCMLISLLTCVLLTFLQDCSRPNHGPPVTKHG